MKLFSEILVQIEIYQIRFPELIHVLVRNVHRLRTLTSFRVSFTMDRRMLNLPRESLRTSR